MFGIGASIQTETRVILPREKAWINFSALLTLHTPTHRHTHTHSPHTHK